VGSVFPHENTALLEVTPRAARSRLFSVVKLLSKRWWIPAGARPEGPKLELEGPRAEVGFPTADQGLSNIQGTLIDFYGI